jgi:pilus assembly protein Flp/PilA
MDMMHSSNYRLKLYGKHPELLFKPIINCILKLRIETKAVTAIEYALIAAVISLLIVGAVISLGINTQSTLNSVANGFPATGSNASSGSSAGSTTSSGSGLLAGHLGSGAANPPP